MGGIGEWHSTADEQCGDHVDARIKPAQVIGPLSRLQRAHGEGEFQRAHVIDETMRNHRLIAQCVEPSQFEAFNARRATHLEQILARRQHGVEVIGKQIRVGLNAMGDCRHS